MKSLAPWTLLLVSCLGCAQAASQVPATNNADEQDATQVQQAGDTADAAGETTNDQVPATADAQPSPFDYNPSEEISEDLSVSFPVDI